MTRGAAVHAGGISPCRFPSLWPSQATVTGAVELARIVGASERVIGLTIVAAGTSLPEVVTSLVSVVRGRDDVAIGNVIGSNLFNVLGILGLSALVGPLGVNPLIIARLVVDAGDDAGAAAGLDLISAACPAGYTHPACLRANPSFQIFVMWRILSPSNSIT